MAEETIRIGGVDPERVVDPGKNAVYTPGRRMGNSTRIIDAAIQALFEGKIVAVRDHYATPRSNRHLMDNIIRRLRVEHQHVKFKVYKNRMLIQLEE